MDGSTDVPDRVINPVALPVWYISQSTKWKWERDVNLYYIQWLLLPPSSLFLFQVFQPNCVLFSAHERKLDDNWQNLEEYLSPSKTLGSHLNLLLFLIIIVHSQSGATFLCAAWLKYFLISTHCNWGEGKLGPQMSMAPHAQSLNFIKDPFCSLGYQEQSVSRTQW